MTPRIKPPVPPKHAAAVTFDSEAAARRRLMNSEFCAACGKLRLRTKEDAHSYIGLMISKPARKVKRGTFALAPYRCPINGWHIGSHKNTAELLEAK
jgi:hypothetical protein